jgi:hypothetical protein
MDEPEQLWSDLLSANPDRIKTRWQSLSTDETQAVKAHLTNIVNDPDYSDVQKEAARTAMNVIETLK